MVIDKYRHSHFFIVISLFKGPYSVFNAVLSFLASFTVVILMGNYTQHLKLLTYTSYITHLLNFYFSASSYFPMASHSFACVSKRVHLSWFNKFCNLFIWRRRTKSLKAEERKQKAHNEDLFLNSKSIQCNFDVSFIFLVLHMRELRIMWN